MAWNADLANAAQGQSQYMADNQIQSHTGADGSTPAAANRGGRLHQHHFQRRERLRLRHVARGGDAGVPDRLGRSQRRPPNQYPAARRCRPKRVSPTSAVGIVQTSASNPSFGPMVITQDFGSQANTQAQVVGVAYNDNSGTGFYQPGEGQGGVQIDAVNLQTGQVISTQTWASGGYELALPAGQYRIIASLNDTVFQTTNVTVSNVNIEQDFVLTNTWQGGTRESAIAAAQPPAPPSSPFRHAESSPFRRPSRRHSDAHPTTGHSNARGEHS